MRLHSGGGRRHIFGLIYIELRCVVRVATIDNLSRHQFDGSAVLPTIRICGDIVLRASIADHGSTAVMNVEQALVAEACASRA